MIAALDPARPVPRRRWSLPREGLIWAAASAALWAMGWWKGINLVLLLSYLMGAVFVVNVWVARRHLAPVAARGVDGEAAFAGSEFVVEVEVSAKTAGFSVGHAGHGGGWFVASQPGGPVRLRRAAVFHERGVFPVGGLRAWGRYPFGLVRHSREIGDGGEVVVYPRLGRADGRLLADWLAGKSAGDGRRRLPRPAAVGEAEADGLRPYRVGDSPRWVHWRTSARRGELMVREFVDVQTPDLLLIVEAYLPDRATGRERAHLEWAMSLAGSVLWEWGRRHGVELAVAVVGAASAAESGAAGRPLAHRGLELMAREAGSPRPDVDGLMSDFRRAWQSLPCLVVSSRDGTPLAASVSAKLGRPAAAVGPASRLAWYQEPTSHSLGATRP